MHVHTNLHSYPCYDTALTSICCVCPKTNPYPNSNKMHTLQLNLTWTSEITFFDIQIFTCILIPHEIYWSWHICQKSHFLSVNTYFWKYTFFTRAWAHTKPYFFLYSLEQSFWILRWKQLFKHLQEPRLSKTWSHTFSEFVRIPRVFVITFLSLVSRCELSPGFASVPNYGGSPRAHVLTSTTTATIKVDI